MSFPLVGNDRLKSTVENMLSSGRIPHALLIEGESGTGKTALSRYLCRAAVCEGEIRPCDRCDGCRLFENGNHPDVSFIAPEKDKKTISVNQIRDIVLAASVIPQRSDRKVFVIDPGDSMTPAAQNALLKVLEEPPRGVIFIITAASKTVLLPTVVSRCTLLTIGIPDVDSATDCILSLVKCDRQAAALAYKESGGSIGGAINILKSKSASPVFAIAEEFVRLFQNGSQYDILKALLPLEKDRAKAYEFYNALEAVIASKMRGLNSPTLVSRYEKLYGKIAEHKKLLKTNVNLSLLFSSLAAGTTAER